MKITLFPFLGYDEYTASINGDIITINGEVIDLSPLQEGYRLLGIETGNRFIVPTSYIERINGEISITLFLNVHEDTDVKWRDPISPNVLIVEKGMVDIPDTSPPTPEVMEVPPLIINPEENHDKLVQH